MKTFTAPSFLFLVLHMAACSEPPKGTPDLANPPPPGADLFMPGPVDMNTGGEDLLKTDGGANPGELTLANCTTSIDAGAPAFFKNYFSCVTITSTATGVTITTKGLPPHRSYYYGAGNPNYVAFDYTRGAMYRPNPNKIATATISVTVPIQPTAKGLTITAALVDGVVGTSTDEYRLGPQGVALDSVYLFNPLAAPGDLIENEKYTFDSYNAHPEMMGAYHYHTNTLGPLEVLQAKGMISTTKLGQAEIEVYGIMCDGTVVMGCTELNGAAPQAAGLDAQNGHVHDLTDKAGAVLLAQRYHTHICPEKSLGRHKFTPEIQYYRTCTVVR